MLHFSEFSRGPDIDPSPASPWLRRSWSPNYSALVIIIFLQAYDNVESSVRKASVFCMVSLHQLVGDELQQHLESLNGSKLKLLNLYIKRAQAQKEQSAPVSPRQVSTPL
jgi:hypothetical protein